MADGVSQPSRSPKDQPAKDSAGRGAKAPPPVSGTEALATSASDQKLDDAPEMLGEFRLLRRLGRGGMADVYLAEQTSLKRNVAIKILRGENVEDENLVRRFQTEAKAAGGLNHPNIVQVYVIGEEQGVHFIAQEYVQGQNLREFINRKGPPDLNVALHIMRQVAAALHVASEAGIVHRDIKPENILITRKGEVKVADFGLAQLTLGGERLNLTKENTTLGTPLYMSPEQVNGSKLDPRSDIYSFGVTCYHMLSGAPPFQGDNAIAVAVQHLKNEPEPLEKRRPGLPPLLYTIIEKMMAKDLTARYQTAQAVLKEIKRLRQEGAGAESVDDAGVSTTGAGRLQPILAFADRPLRRQVWLIATLALLVGAGAAGAGWLMRTKNPLVESPPARKAVIPDKKGTVQEQFLLAMTDRTSEPAWRAVIEHFPRETKYVHRAKEQLAMLLLNNRDDARAQELFDELARVSDGDKSHRILGRVGQAFLATERGEYEESQKILAAIRPDFATFQPTDWIRQVVRHTSRKNQEVLKSDEGAKWEALLSPPPPPPPPPPADGGFGEQ